MVCAQCRTRSKGHRAVFHFRTPAVRLQMQRQASIAGLFHHPALPCANRVERGCGWSICIGVKRWNTIAALLLLGLWAACSVNCAFESLSRAEPPTCCSDKGGDSDNSPVSSSSCACSVLVSGAYVPHSQVWLVALPADAISASFALGPCQTSTAQTFVPGPDSSPPELAGSWQFIVRTALPARAPSSVS